MKTIKQLTELIGHFTDLLVARRKLEMTYMNGQISNIEYVEASLYLDKLIHG